MSYKRMTTAEPRRLTKQDLARIETREQQKERRKRFRRKLFGFIQDGFDGLLLVADKMIELSIRLFLMLVILAVLLFFLLPLFL